MKVILFGATGMVGQGVLRECLLDDGIEGVLAIGRTSPGLSHPKLTELLRNDLFDFGGVAVELQGHDACFFCLGVSSAGMTEAEYIRLTYDLTIGWANELARINPAMTFIYVSGAGTGGKWKFFAPVGATCSAPNGAGIIPYQNSINIPRLTALGHLLQR